METNASLPKAIYGSVDTRCNLFDLEKGVGKNDQAHLERIKKLAKSVGCLAWEGHFERRKEGDVGPWYVKGNFFDSHFVTLKSFLENDFVEKDHPVVNGVKVSFELEPCLGKGTAFLVAKDLVLTAAHCVFDELAPTQEVRQCPKLWILDFEHKIDQNGKKYEKLTFRNDHVYKIVDVVAHKLIKRGQDWALLKLDREVKGREPLKINFSAKIETSKKLWVLGHPCGLPIKWAGDASVKLVDSKERGKDYLEADLSTFQGNSGSPVFLDDNSEIVAGMLCRGNPDFYLDEKNIVREKNYGKEKSEKWELVLKMSALTFESGQTLEAYFYGYQSMISSSLSLEVRKKFPSLANCFKFRSKIDNSQEAVKLVEVLFTDDKIANQFSQELYNLGITLQDGRPRKVNSLSDSCFYVYLSHDDYNNIIMQDESAYEKLMNSTFKLESNKAYSKAIPESVPPIIKKSGGVIKPLPFVNLSEGKEVTIPIHKAMTWGLVSPGLNLIGICLNSKCEASNQKVLIPKGFGTFHMGKQVHEVKCPCCQQPIDRVDNCCFYKCIFSIEGALKKQDEVINVTDNDFTKRINRSAIHTSDNACVTFNRSDENNPAPNYYYLKITTEPKPDETTCVIV